MSRKISEFFKPKSEPESDSDKAAVKHEEEGDFDINFNKVKKEIKIEENSPKIREFRVVLKDIKKEEVQENLKAKLKGKKGGSKCNFCGKKFSHKSSLAAHEKELHSNEIKNFLNCYICDVNFIKKHKFEQHMKAKHNDGKTEENFECDFDGKIFSTRRNMQSHMQSHQMTIKCEICQAEFKPFSMNQHKKLIHPTGQKLDCKICSKSFNATNKLRNHEKIHNKKFECEICNKKFSTFFYLKTHKKEYHENRKGFECEICSRKFSQKIVLKKHEKTHDKNRPKPFKCQRCVYATDNSHNYKNHQNFHERQDKKFAAMKNPLKCEKCSTFCRNKETLQMHMKVVHPENLFQCDLCGRYIKTFNDVKKHLKIHQSRSNF